MFNGCKSFIVHGQQIGTFIKVAGMIYIFTIDVTLARRNYHIMLINYAESENPFV